MNKRKLVISIWSGIIFTCVASGLIASIAWFASANKFDVDITGSVVEEYFHTGTGTANNPFVITRPIHYYHLVEFFQRETALDATAEFGTDYLYFQVGYDLDNDGDLEVYEYDDQGIYQGTSETPSYSKTLNMAYYSGTNALMPIGTNEVPFIGSFDGKADEEIVISHLNIHCAETVVIEGTGTVDRAASDIGMFGYVADKDGSNNPTIIKNMKVDGLNIDLSDVTSTVASPTTGIAHTDAHDGEAYVGYIAGHVHSYTTYSNTGPTNASPLYNVYVANATIEGGAGTTCGFGYIGLVDTVNGEAPSTIESQVTSVHSGGSGQDDTWGGSFNSKTYTNLLYDINHTTTSETTNTFSGDGGYVVTKTASATTNPNTSQVVYRLRNGSYIPLKFANNTYAQASLGNTGYLVGSNIGTGANASPKISSYKMVNLQNALTNDRCTSMADAYKAANIAYTDSKLEVMTYLNGWKRIKDSHNENNNSTNGAITSYTKTNLADFGFVKYADSRDALQEVLESSPFVHGIHFDNNAVSTSNLLTVPANVARIQGHSVSTTYQLPKGSIDFNLKEQGLINFFAGTYNSSQVNLNFFSLYEVTRNANGNITALTQIRKIYLASSGDGYIYQTGNSKPSGAGDLAFDIETVLHGNAPVINMMYYFEIPVNAGEYAMGVAGSTQGAYMIYLDLAANGSEEEETHNQTISIADVALFTQMDYQIDNYVINSCFNIAFVIPAGATKETFSVTISTDDDVIHEGHTYFSYEIVIKNTTQHDLTISALLTDNDNDPENEFFYMYAIKYNTGSRTEYFNSNTFTGVSGGTTMTPTYTPPQEEGGD